MQVSLKIRAFDKKNNSLLKFFTCVAPQFNVCLPHEMKVLSSDDKRFTALLYNIILDDKNYSINLWTGLNDQLDRGIFEDDIVRSQIDNKDYIVTYGLIEDNSEKKNYTFNIGFGLKEIKTGKIEKLQYNLILLGNKWENPELLKNE